jgi:hypothetical protein
MVQRANLFEESFWGGSNVVSAIDDLHNKVCALMNCEKIKSDSSPSSSGTSISKTVYLVDSRSKRASRSIGVLPGIRKLT